MLLQQIILLFLALTSLSVSARPVEQQITLRTEADTLSSEYALVCLPSRPKCSTPHPLHLTHPPLLQTSPHQAFDLWLVRYNKDYIHDKDERAKRLGVFKQNAATIATHNANPSSTFTMALNQFADLTFEEFSMHRLGYNTSLRDNTPVSLSSISNKHKREGFRYADLSVSDLPASMDWRKEGAVTPVKNQGMCGSCWSFSATGAIEGINKIQTGKLMSLSEQQLVSCDREKDMGCGGGLMDFAFEYVVQNGGIDTEEDYGYWGWGMPCNRRREHDRPAVTIDGYEDVPAKDADALKKVLANQPVAVAICANANLQFYQSGVVNEQSCCQELNHGVLAVGYNEGDGTWIVKNSWGESWGEDGFFRLTKDAKNPNGACGILQAASYPVKETHSNPEVPDICGFFGWTECPLHQTCNCRWSFFNLFCFSWGCDASKEQSSMEL